MKKMNRKPRKLAIAMMKKSSVTVRQWCYKCPSVRIVSER